MSKFYTNLKLLIISLIFAAVAIILTIPLILLKESLGQFFEILKVYTLFFGCSSSILLILLFFNFWVVEISEQGILYRNIFKYRKFKRFFSWEEIAEIEILMIPFINIKRLYITKIPLCFEEKLSINMRNVPDAIILNTASKKLVTEIKKHYNKEIISGRNHKNAHKGKY